MDSREIARLELTDIVPVHNFIENMLGMVLQRIKDRVWLRDFYTRIQSDVIIYHRGCRLI